MGCWIDRYRWPSILLVCLLLVGSKGFGQGIDLVPFSISVETPEKLRPEDALKLFSDSSLLISENTTFGFSENYFWILLTLPKDVSTSESYFLDIDNPHIDHIQAYCISNGKLSFLGRSGDRMPFSERTYQNRRNVFPVQFNSLEDRILLFVDKRNASVTVPLKLWESHAFFQHEARSNMVYGLYFGMLLIIILYSLLIFLVQRSGVYLWYMIYVLSMFLYLFTHVGYGFQFLFPNQFEWSNYLRLIMIVLIVISQIRFTQLFLPIRSVAIWVNRIYNFIIAALVGIVLWWILVPGLFTANTIIVINVIYGFIGLTAILLFVALIRSWKPDRTSVLFYTAAFGMNLLATFLMIAEEYGAIRLTWLPLPPIFIGSLFEILIFAVGLSYRSKLIGDDRRKLLADINHLQQHAMQSFVRGMEEEKVRVANELHDDVASRLSLLKMKLTESSDQELSGQLAEIADGVRRISHQLNPVSLDDQTFLEKMKELVSEHRKSGMQIDLQVFDMRKSVPKETGLQLYRILQEALQNIRKHAKAKMVEVQLFQHENELVMTVEDDGAGFDQTKKNTAGLGTKNMRLRAEQMKGEFSISSAVGEGTSIMVSVPIG
ncbi:MAG: hypothetical protein GC178_04505 [Flavobacteriales bacterium]|nr:hypothetical protein [Flavobacteriales bacterium]